MLFVTGALNMASMQLKTPRAMRFVYVCEVECEALGRVTVNRIKNLSVTGAWIETMNPPPEGSILNLCFSVGSVDVRTKAKVVRRLIGEGMGVDFQDLLPHYRETIDTLSVAASREAEHSNQIFLRQIMTTQVVTVGMDDEIETVQALFERFHFHHLLVLREDGTLVGVVSDRDLLKSVSPFISTLGERSEDLRTLKKRVHQIMSRNVITATKDHTAHEAAVLMLNSKISCLPIVQPNGTVEGIVTCTDIMKWLVRQV
jgi:acetoin utilization protein AcuB